jgi:hypothetical protein
MHSCLSLRDDNPSLAMRNSRQMLISLTTKNPTCAASWGRQ